MVVLSKNIISDSDCSLADSGFFLDCLYQGGVKPTVFEVFQDLKFKISEGSNQNW